MLESGREAFFQCLTITIQCFNLSVSHGISVASNKVILFDLFVTLVFSHWDLHTEGIDS